MAEYLIQSETLNDIADAINAKTGGSSAMTPAQMVEAIGGISGGGSQISKDSWTLVSDMNTNTQGFYYGTYCDRTFNGMQLFNFEDNQASSYRAIMAFIDNAVAGTSRSAFKASNSGNISTTGSSAGYLFNASSGCTITRYKFDYQGV